MLTAIEESSAPIEETSEGTENGGPLGSKVGEGIDEIVPLGKSLGNPLGTSVGKLPETFVGSPLGRSVGKPLVTFVGNPLARSLGKSLRSPLGNPPAWLTFPNAKPVPFIDGNPPIVPFKPPKPPGVIANVKMLLPFKKLDRISENGSEILENADVKSNPPWVALSTGENPSPTNEEGCPMTPVRFTLFTVPVSPLKIAGMRYLKRALNSSVPWSPRPMVALTLKGPAMLVLKPGATIPVVLLEGSPPAVCPVWISGYCCLLAVDCESADRSIVNLAED